MFSELMIGYSLGVSAAGFESKHHSDFWIGVQLAAWENVKFNAALPAFQIRF